MSDIEHTRRSSGATQEELSFRLHFGPMIISIAQLIGIVHSLGSVPRDSLIDLTFFEI